MAVGRRKRQHQWSACLQTGNGVERDRQKARHWRELAIAGGSVAARKQAILAETQNAMTAGLDGDH